MSLNLKQHITIVFVSGLAGVILFGFLFQHPPLERVALQVAPVNEISCSTGNWASDATMHVYGENIRGGQALISALCASGGVQQKYADVSYTWALNEIDLEASIRDFEWDLAFGRRHLFEGTEKIPSGYTAIAEYAVYKAYLIFKSATDPDRLPEMKIGILANAESSSGHKVPKAYFRSIGLKPENLALRLYPNHASLRSALASGEVDVIGSYWNETDREKFPEFREMEIQEGLVGSQWFVQSTTFDHAITCIYTSILESLASITEDRYFQNINILRSCEQ